MTQIIHSQNGGGGKDEKATWGKINGNILDQTDLVEELDKKPDASELGTTAFSNDYNDLDNQPTIGGGVLTIKQNENTKATFNANATTNATAEIVVPTKVSELQNDANYLTSYTETDPTVPSHVKSITEANITSWNGKYAKPSGGIPKTDLASAVQTSLGKADTAVQPSQLNSFATLVDLSNGLKEKQDKALVTTLDNADDTHYPSAKAVADAMSGAGLGDMLKSVYDPTNKNGDAFDAHNFHNLDTQLNENSTYAVQNQAVAKKINEIELSKAPNVSIVGEPTILNGNISGFSASNYLIAPFLSSFAGYPFTFHMDITTGTDVNTQQNILDAEYGLALAIINGRFVMALSTNGTSWDLGSHTGTYVVKASTSYCVEIEWTGTAYILRVSTDRVNFTTDITVNSSTHLSGNTLYIGGFGTVVHPFTGTLNFNEWQFLSGTIVVWKGMDDAGLATRANLSLSNLNVQGEARFDAKQDVISDLTDIRNRATDWNTYKPTVTSHIGNGTIHVTASDKIAWSQKYAKPTNGIPKTDLDSGVQASLGLADSALQSYTETDPVFTNSAAHGISQTDITNWNNKGTYSKPNDGIPKSDLSQSVQASLGKADTALQGFTESDPTVPSYVKSITQTNITTWNNAVQPSGLKTINGESIVGSGDIEIKGGGGIASTTITNEEVVSVLPANPQPTTIYFVLE